MIGLLQVLVTQRASSTALGKQSTIPAFLGSICTRAHADTQRVFPDGFPIIVQDIAHRPVGGLAGQDFPIRLDAHIIERRRAAFYPQVQQDRIEMAILGR